MAESSVMPTFEPSFKATTVDEEFQIVEVVGGQERVWVPLDVLRRNLAGQLLLQGVTSNWFLQLFQWRICNSTQGNQLHISAESPAHPAVGFERVYTIEAGKETISVPESVLEASWSGKVLLKHWNQSRKKKSHCCN